jgi:Fic family protein
MREDLFTEMVRKSMANKAALSLLNKIAEQEKSSEKLGQVATIDLINELVNRKETIAMTIYKDQKFEIVTDSSSIEGNGTTTILVIAE